MKLEPLKFLLELIYPPKCVFCQAVLKASDICDDCVNTLPYTVGDAIYQKFPFIDKCVSPLYYKGNVRDAILRFKFYGAQSYSLRFGMLMSECAEKNLDCGSIDMISCIPLARKRYKKRGYNQSELLAKELSAKTGVPFSHTLKKIKNTSAQSTIRDAKLRSQNISGAYKVICQDLTGKTVLLVDDVVTTGSTISECARMLKKAGAAHVFGITLARHED